MDFRVSIAAPNKAKPSNKVEIPGVVTRTGRRRSRSASSPRSTRRRFPKASGPRHWRGAGRPSLRTWPAAGSEGDLAAVRETGRGQRSSERHRKSPPAEASGQVLMEWTIQNKWGHQLNFAGGERFPSHSKIWNPIPMPPTLLARRGGRLWSSAFIAQPCSEKAAPAKLSRQSLSVPWPFRAAMPGRKRV